MNEKIDKYIKKLADELNEDIKMNFRESSIRNVLILDYFQ